MATEYKIENRILYIYLDGDLFKVVITFEAVDKES